MCPQPSVIYISLFLLTSDSPETQLPLNSAKMITFWSSHFAADILSLQSGIAHSCIFVTLTNRKAASFESDFQEFILYKYNTSQCFLQRTVEPFFFVFLSPEINLINLSTPFPWSQHKDCFILNQLVGLKKCLYN